MKGADVGVGHSVIDELTAARGGHGNACEHPVAYLG
jgi:hypothetical protein